MSRCLRFLAAAAFGLLVRPAAAQRVMECVVVDATPSSSSLSRAAYAAEIGSGALRLLLVRPQPPAEPYVLNFDAYETTRSVHAEPSQFWLATAGRDTLLIDRWDLADTTRVFRLRLRCPMQG